MLSLLNKGLRQPTSVTLVLLNNALSFRINSLIKKQKAAELEALDIRRVVGADLLSVNLKLMEGARVFI